MKLSSMLRLAAMVVAVCGLALFVAAPEAQAQANPPGLSKDKDKNGGNNGQTRGNNGNNKSQREKNCNGNARACGDNEDLTQEVTDIATEDGGIVLDCTLPEFSADPRCVAPTKKKAKRKVVSVKLSNEEQIAPPVAAVVEAAPAPVVTPAPVVAPAVVVAPAPKPKSSTIIDPNDLTSNTFQ